MDSSILTTQPQQTPQVPVAVYCLKGFIANKDAAPELIIVGINNNRQICSNVV